MRIGVSTPRPVTSTTRTPAASACAMAARFRGLTDSSGAEERAVEVEGDEVDGAAGHGRFRERFGRMIRLPLGGRTKAAADSNAAGPLSR